MGQYPLDIVPRFIVFISKNLEKLSHSWKIKFSEETTESVRLDLEAQILELGDKLDIIKQLAKDKEERTEK